MVTSAIRTVCLLLLVGTMPACVGPKPATDAAVEDSDPSSSVDPNDPFAPFLNETQNGTIDTKSWFLLPAKSSVEGRLQTFRLVVPNGSVIKDERFADRVRFTMEIVPWLTNASRASLEEWGLFFFREINGTATYYGSVLAPALTVTQRTLGSATPKVEKEPPSASSFFVRWFLGSLPEGSIIHVVVAARGPATDFGLAIRALDKVPAPADEPAKDFESFLAKQARRTPVLLRPVANGTGLKIASYVDANLAFTGGLEARSGSVVVDDRPTLDLRPGFAARDLTLRSAADPPAGWAAALGLFSSSVGSTVWSFSGETRGARLETHGVTSGHSIFLAGFATDVLLGFPQYSIFGDGDGPSKTEFHPNMAEAMASQTIVFSQVDLGSPLTSLVGAPGADSVWHIPSRLDGLPLATRFTPSGLVIERGGSTEAILLGDFA